MTERRPPKKSAMLEVRLSHEAKEALMARCRAEGVSASEFVRANIERFLQEGAAPQAQPAMQPARPNRLQAFVDSLMDLAAAPRAALAAVGIAAGMMVAINPSIATPDFEAMFARFDHNADGALTPDEFEVAALDGKLVVRPQAELEPVAVPMPCPDMELQLEGAEFEDDAEREREQAAFEAEMEAFEAQAEQFDAQAEEFARQMEAQAAQFQTLAMSDAQRNRWEAQAAHFQAQAERMEAEGQRFAERAQAHAERQAARAERHAEQIAAREAARIDHASIRAQAMATAREAMAASFDRMDRNRDGRLTAEDFRDRNGVEVIRHLDDDGDGAVSRSEFQCP